MPRKLKDGWPIYKEWVEYDHYDEILDEEGKIIGVKGRGKRTHWVRTTCSCCGINHVAVKLSVLVAGNSLVECEGCYAYRGHY
jgi:hypothetical protein